MSSHYNTNEYVAYYVKTFVSNRIVTLGIKLLTNGISLESLNIFIKSKLDKLGHNQNLPITIDLKVCTRRTIKDQPIEDMYLCATATLCTGMSPMSKNTKQLVVVYEHTCTVRVSNVIIHT